MGFPLLYLTFDSNFIMLGYTMEKVDNLIYFFHGYTKPLDHKPFNFVYSFLSCRRSRRTLFSSRFFLLSGNTSFSYTSWYPISTKLGHSDQYLNHYSGTNNDGVKGHDGVTGVKNVIFTENAISPTDYMVWSCDSSITISYIPSTKVMGLEIHPGSFGVTDVKRSFLPKILFLLQITCYGHVTHVYWSAIYPLQKLWV